MTTNLTNLTGSQTFYDLALFVNQESNSLFFLLFVIVLFVIITLALKKNDTMDALWVASFVCFLISLLLSSIQLLATLVIFPFLFLFVIIGFYIYVTRR